MMSEEKLDRLAREFHAALEARLAGEKSASFRLPSKDAVATISRLYLESIFPVYFHYSASTSGSKAAEDKSIVSYLMEFESLLIEQLCCAFRFDSNCKRDTTPANLNSQS
jgi:hypothetical protein